MTDHEFDDPDCTDPECDLHEEPCADCGGTDKHLNGCPHLIGLGL